MRSYEFWRDAVSKEAKLLKFEDGYKILYCPWATIGRAETAFLSLNPGKPPIGVDLYTLTDERGNSYEVEKEITRSPITDQFLQLAALLDLPPKDILTGVVVPFRSNRWKEIPIAKRKAALSIGEKFWREVFDYHRPKRVICCCPEAASIASEILGARPELELPSGWGNISLRRYRARDGALVAQIPHLSTFKLLSRPSCIGPLRTVLYI
jgi:hypothetical protein